MNDLIDAQLSSSGSDGALVLFNGACAKVNSGFLLTSTGPCGQAGAGSLININNHPIVLHGSGTTIISGSDGDVGNLSRVRIDPLRMDYQLENQAVVLNVTPPIIISSTLGSSSGGALSPWCLLALGALAALRLRRR